MWNTKKRKNAKLFVLKRSKIFVSYSFWWNIYFSLQFQKYDKNEKIPFFRQNMWDTKKTFRWEITCLNDLLYCIVSFYKQFCDDFFHEIWDFFFKSARSREKSIYRKKNPTYVSWCCSIESKKRWFFVPGQKLWELGFRLWTP